MSLENFLKIFENSNYGLFMTVISIIVLIYGLYQKIKFNCLEKASKMVAEVEANTELTGEQKFAQVVLWINEELPVVFRNSLFKSIIEKLTDFAYNTSFEYMKKYVKRTTGHDVSKVIDTLKETIIEENNEEEKK